MLLTFAIFLVLGSAQLSHSICVSPMLHPQTALCNQEYAIKGKIISSTQTRTSTEDSEPEGSSGVTYQVKVMRVLKDINNGLTENEVITVTTRASTQNGISWLVVGTKYLMTVSSSNTIDTCNSYVVAWDNLPLPKGVYKWKDADDNFKGSQNCDKCEINFGTPKNTATVCDFNYQSTCHLYERCSYDANLGQCGWSKFPQEEVVNDCAAGVEGAE